MPPSAGLFCLQTIENTMEDADPTERGRSAKRTIKTKLSNLRGVFDPVGTREPSSGHPIASEFVTAFSHWARRSIPGYPQHSPKLCAKLVTSLD